MHPLLNVADRAARKAGDIIIRSMDRLDLIKKEEKSPHDYVTDVDRRAEQEIIDIIKKHYPDHAIIAEESGHIPGQEDYTWIIDPLDGTTNFIHGFPHFCVSIAIQHKNRIEHGLIYDPVKQEVFSATRGSGALLNQKRLRVPDRRPFDEALISTGLPYRDTERLGFQLKILHAIQIEACDIRRTGSAALDLAYVAAGRFDGYWELGLKLWDIAAGALIVQEAGGLVSGLGGYENHLETGDILAANPKVFKRMLQIMKPVLAGETPIV